MTRSVSLIALPGRIFGVLVVLLLVACGGEQVQMRTDMMVPTPTAIRQVQAVDPTALSATVSVNGASFNLLPDSETGDWSATVDVPASGVTDVTITWFEIYQGVRLQLAQQTRSVDIGIDGATVEFGDAYVVSGEGFDRDNDGFSNLDERNLNTSPIDSADRPDNATMLLTVNLPPQFALLRGGVVAVAIRDGVDVPLIKQSDTLYTGSVNGLPTNTEIALTVNVNSQRFSNVPVAQAMRTINLIAGENSVTVLAGDFSTAADSDSDGRTNIEEVRQNRDPLNLVDYSIAKTSNTAVIDGVFDDVLWSGLFQANGATSARTIDTLVFSEGSGLTSDGLFSEWAAIADDANLYIAVRIIDNVVSFDSGLQWWNDDSIEWFVDGDYSRLASYDGINDLHLTFRVGDEQVFRNQNSIDIPAGLNYIISQAGFDADIASGNFDTDVNGDNVTDTGYNLELSVPLAELDLQPGQPFGINFEYNDDDDGAGRDSKYSWVGETGADIGHIDPRAMGTAQIDN